MLNNCTIWLMFMLVFAHYRVQVSYYDLVLRQESNIQQSTKICNAHGQMLFKIVHTSKMNFFYLDTSSSFSLFFGRFWYRNCAHANFLSILFAFVSVSSLFHSVYLVCRLPLLLLLLTMMMMMLFRPFHSHESIESWINMKGMVRSERIK